VVKDVCEECNGSKLNELDTYFCQLYDRSFAEVHDFDSEVVFEYEFDKLARCLLKIAYNSARAAGSSVEAFLPLREYIRTGEERPRLFALLLEVVSPSLVPDPAAPEGLKKVLPTMYRSGITKFTKPSGRHLYTRIVAVNSFYFHLALPAGEVSQPVFEDAISDLIKFIEGTVQLTPARRAVTLRSSPQDGLRSMMPHLKLHADKYRKFFERRKKSR